MSTKSSYFEGEIWLGDEGADPDELYYQGVKKISNDFKGCYDNGDWSFQECATCGWYYCDECISDPGIIVCGCEVDES